MKEVKTPDTFLLERFQRGDMDAMDTLIQRHQTRAYQFAYKLTKDKDMAADIVADAFLRVYRSAHSFKGQSAFTTWLYRILTNCFLDMRKKALSRPVTSFEALLQGEDTTLEVQFEDLSPSPYDELERGEKNRSVQAAVETLMDHHRLILTMYHIELLSYEEIGEVLKIPMGTVKSRLNRARLSLSSVIQPDRSLFVSEGIAA